MRRKVVKVLKILLLVMLVAGGVVGWRAFRLGNTAYKSYQHLRYLLESGESIEGEAADDVLSDNYLRSLFGDNPELVERLKTVVDLGMATDANLKLGSVSLMVVTYRKGDDGAISDAAIYAVGGFPEPKSRRLGFHSTGYFRTELDPQMWLTGNALMNLLGRDIIVFCEEEKAEAHMELLFDMLQGRIMPLAQKIAEAPLHYAIVFPTPGELAPPNMRRNLQTVIIKGRMDGDQGETDVLLVSPSYRASMQTYSLTRDMFTLARIVFHDHFGGYIKEEIWGKMDDVWWAREYVELIDATKLVQEQVLVSGKVEYNRAKNNALLKTVERACRDIAMQKSYLLASDLPWEFAYRTKNSPTTGYWSEPHRWGPEWPLGEEGVPTPGSIAAAAERERLRAEKEAERQRQKESPPSTQPAGEPVRTI